MYNIDKEIENQIYDAVNKIVDQYLGGKTLNTQHVRNVFSKDDYDNYFQSSTKTLKQAKKEFSKKSNLKKLLTDIKYVGFHLFDQDEVKYKMIVKNILKDIIEDRIAEENDKKNINKMKKLQTFESFKANESILLDFEGKTLSDGEYELYINFSFLELIDPKGNNGDGKVIYQFPLPKRGQTINMDGVEPEDDNEPQLFFEDSGSYLEFIENGKIVYTFDLD